MCPRGLGERAEAAGGGEGCAAAKALPTVGAYEGDALGARDGIIMPGVADGDALGACDGLAPGEGGEAENIPQNVLLRGQLVDWWGHSVLDCVR
jgi:hypothetical protein